MKDKRWLGPSVLFAATMIGLGFVYGFQPAAPPIRADKPASKIHTHYRRPGIRAHVTGTSYTPPGVAAKYNFPNGVTGHGALVGIIELGGAYNPSDITTYMAGLGISPTGVLQVITVQGARPPTSDGPTGADGEVMLDAEVIYSIAPGANINMYFADNTAASFLAGCQQARQDGCKIISISWGGPEAGYSAAELQAFNTEFETGANSGVNYFVAAGDNGSNDGTTGLAVDFPGSSPWVICCGGTSLPASGAETVWNNGPSNGATGGGISAHFPKPAWQTVQPFGVTSTVANRMSPDIAGNADPDTGYQTLVDGTSGTIGGTSAVAPLYAAMTALYWEKLGKAPGFLGPQLYGVVSPYQKAFIDIVQGNNGNYKAGTGFDCATGIGRPDGANLLTALGGPSGGGGGGGPTATPAFTLNFPTAVPAGATFRIRTSKAIAKGFYNAFPVTAPAVEVEVEAVAK
jgi:kumamolisin